MTDTLPKTKQTAAELIEAVYATPIGFQRIWKALDDYERFVFGVALLEMRSDGYTHGVSRAKLVQLLNQRPVQGRQPEVALARLAQLGLLTASKIWYLGEGFELSETIAPLVYSALLKDLDASPISDLRPLVATETGRDLSRDMVRLLSHAVKTPPNVTKNGSLYRREINKLKPLFRCLDVAGISAAGPWEGVPFGIYIAVTTLQRMRIVGMLEGSFQVFGEALHELLQMPESTLRETVQDTVLRGFPSGSIHLYGILETWFAAAPAGQWASVMPALAASYGCVEAPEWARDGVMWVSIMASAGLLDEGRHGAYGRLPLCRRPAPLAVDGQRTGRWIVQPNFDLLVPEDAPLALHFLAGQLADVVRADVMSVYRLGKQSVLRLLDRGWKLAEIEACLADFSGTSLPKTITRALQDWAREHERAVVWDVMLVRFQSPQLLAQFVADERAGQLIVETVGDAAVIIRRNAEKRAREILSDLGAAPPEHVRRPGEDHVVSADGQRRSGANTKANTLALRRLTSPAVRELLPKSM